MQLQRVIRAAACAALCAALFAGATLFPARTAAGQETDSVASGGEAAGQLNRDGREQGLRAALTQARYGVTRAADTPLGRWAWYAPNPAAGYDAYITEEGVTIVVGGEPYVSLGLRGIGYGTGLRAVAPGQVSGDKQTVNLTRDGSVQEWYVNSPDGLEQGFTLAKPPASRRPGVPLRLGFRISEGWQATASADGRKVTMRGAGGSRVVEYGKLAVRDRTGRDIPARLTAAGEEVFIEVEDGGAAYPLTIDPVFSLQEKLSPADTSGGNSFGYSIALSGDTAVVGAYTEAVGSNYQQGAAYVFTRGEGGWTLQQKLSAGDGGFFDRFGGAVALSGDTLAVGAQMDTVGANYHQGSVYVFTRSNGVWTEQQKLTAGDGEASDGFGYSVAVSGDTLAVGAKVGGNVVHMDHGSAYVYKRVDGVWTERQKLTAGDGEFFDDFGKAVAVGEDTVLVGAPGDDTGESYDHGSVYAFRLPSCPTLMFKPLALPDGLSSVSYEQTVTVSGGAGPFEFTHIAGSLPPGVSLSPSGVLSGTPTTAGTYHFTLLATDASGGCGSVRDYTLAVESCCVTVLKDGGDEDGR